MKSNTLGSFFVVLILTVGIMTFITSSVFADTSVTITKGSGDSQNPACVATNNCFTPNPVNVSPGEKVTWTNTDTSPNTITSGTPKPDNSTGSVFDSGFLGPGNTFSHTFTADDVGTISYFSEIHPWMTGQVIVSAAGTSGETNETETGNNNAVPEFGPIASLVLVIAIVSVIAVTAKTRGFLKI